MRTSRYLAALRRVPAFEHCSDRRLAAIARLVDTVEIPAGAVLRADEREVLVAMTPVRAVVVDRRALARVRELAPALLSARAGDTRVRLVRRSCDGRCSR